MEDVARNKIDQEQIKMYKNDLISAMRKMNASESELALIKEATIINSIRSNRKPEDVAWAILQ